MFSPLCRANAGFAIFPSGSLGKLKWTGRLEQQVKACEHWTRFVDQDWIIEGLVLLQSHNAVIESLKGTTVETEILDFQMIQ